LAIAAVLLGGAESRMATFMVQMDWSLLSPLLGQLLVRMKHLELAAELNFLLLLLGTEPHPRWLRWPTPEYPAIAL